ncbi:hypothetical protein OGZ01_01420 [Vibrio harveyi]|nr:hypothetical protein [Vibrio harveyi]
MTPWACPDEVKEHYDININNALDGAIDSVLIIAVGHDEIVNFARKYEFPYIYDFKGLI